MGPPAVTEIAVPTDAPAVTEIAESTEVVELTDAAEPVVDEPPAKPAGDDGQGR
jgi:hypothetical protein